MNTLRFYSRGTAMVFDLEAHENSVRRFIGRKHDRNGGVPGVDEFGQKVVTGTWPSTHQPQTVPARGEYLLACRGGDLWAADQETADHCGVDFDPTCGGEHESQ